MIRFLPVLFIIACVRQGPVTGGPGDGPAGPILGTGSSTVVLPDPGDTRVVNDRDYLPAALLAIDGASQRVRVAEYLLYDDLSVTTLTEALVRASDRGAQVQVLADQAGDETQGLLDELGLRGVNASMDSRNTTLHAKLIIADDVALVGSHNMTGSALDHNHEGSILVADAEVAGWYAAWFDALWAEPDANPSVPALLRTDLAPLADRQITMALVECFDGAVTEVEVVMYALAWDDRYPGSEVDQVLSALEGAHARGVTVSLVVDGSSWIVSNNINDAAISRLQAAGIALWQAPSWVTTHAKVSRCDDQVVVSDANWSYSGLALMHGTSLVIRDAQLSSDYSAWIAEVRDESTEL